MKHVQELLREKQAELARLRKEVEALRLVVGMISEEATTEAAPQETAALPLAPEASARSASSPVGAVPTAPLAVPAPLTPPQMIMRPPAPAFGDSALASANDALAKRFP